MPEKKETLFVCDRFPELEITIKPEDWKEIDGRAIKVHPVRVAFKRKPFRGNWRGEFKTSDPEMVESLKALDVFLAGTIRIDVDPDKEDQVPPERVRVGMADAGHKQTEVEAPAPSDETPAPAKVAKPKALRKPKPVAA